MMIDDMYNRGSDFEGNILFRCHGKCMEVGKLTSTMTWKEEEKGRKEKDLTPNLEDKKHKISRKHACHWDVCLVVE